MNNAALSINEVSLSLDGQTVVRDLTLEINSGQVTCLLGPSGCGKTTLLRAIAGFVPLLSGRISLHGNTLSSPRIHVAPEKRSIGMLFQQFALFPHLNVEENIRFGLPGGSRKSQQERCTSLLQLTGLSGFEKRYPHTLSGGQQQRVALARALAPRPTVLLMDEPFSSLDLELREELGKEVRDILRNEGTTGVLVTHDQNEAFELADHIAIMNQGAIEQSGDANTLYHAPATPFVARFIGDGAFLDARRNGKGAVETAIGKIECPDIGQNHNKLSAFFRPEAIELSAAGEDACNAVITACRFRGGHMQYDVQLDSGVQLKTQSDNKAPFSLGQRVLLTPRACANIPVFVR